MNKVLKYWQWAGFIFTALCGTLLHFLYEWLGGAILIAPFSGVNESTWEHMKLLFFPSFIFSILQYFFFKDSKSFFCIKLKGIILGLALIPILFYTYNGAIGRSPDWLNISIFFISTAAEYIYETYLFNSDKIFCRSQKSAFYVLCAIALLFVVFTFIPPTLGIFMDPISGGYGIKMAE